MEVKNTTLTRAAPIHSDIIYSLTTAKWPDLVKLAALKLRFAGAELGLVTVGTRLYLSTSLQDLRLSAAIATSPFVVGVLNEY
tara:strand:+ start:303 stop:551 length:249 start_codon:yes stop_codon:yes gene_type:complete